MPAGLPSPSLLTSPHQLRFTVHRLRPHLYRPSRTLPPLHRRRLHRSFPPLYRRPPTPSSPALHRLPLSTPCTDSHSPASTPPDLHRLLQSCALALVCIHGISGSPADRSRRPAGRLGSPANEHVPTSLEHDSKTYRDSQARGGSTPQAHAAAGRK